MTAKSHPYRDQPPPPFHVLPVMRRGWTIFLSQPLLFLAFSASVMIPRAVVLLLGYGNNPAASVAIPERIVAAALSMLTGGAMAFAAMRLLKGGRARFGEAATAACRQWLRLLPFSLLYLLQYPRLRSDDGPSWMALALFIVFCVLYFRLSFFVHACVLENRGIVAGLQRSWELTKKCFWKIVGLYALTFTPIVVMALVLGTVLWRRNEDFVGLEVAAPLLMTVLGAYMTVCLTVAFQQCKNKPRK